MEASMPRAARNNSPGVLYHLVSQFVDREWFIETEAHRQLYLRMLGAVLAESSWVCLGYAVMSNHMHLAVIAGHERLETWMRRLNSGFADYMNREYGRRGAMFVRGPWDCAVPTERAAALLAYIHNNPVRGGAVPSAELSTWTSYQAYLGLCDGPRWLHVDKGRALSSFVDTHSFHAWSSAPERNEYVDEVCRDFEGSATEPMQAVRPEATALVRTVADVVGVSLAQLCSRRRGQREQVARKVAVRAAIQLGVTGKDIASALGITQQAASLISRRLGRSDEIDELCEQVLLSAGNSAS
jgi:hypothetical protein